MPKGPTIQHNGQSLAKRPITRRDFLSTSLKASAATFTTGLLPKRNANAQGQYNVLFITVDDLRPMLGCYGYSEMYTPNIDRIAERGTVFKSAYCQYPLCSPSRTSMITGLRSETTTVSNNSTDFRWMLPDVVTLPQHFKKYGYHTKSVGKIAHRNRFQDDERSWSAPSWRPTKASLNTESTPINTESTLSWQALDVADDALKDGITAKHAANILQKIRDKHFFLAVGFYKPHLPFHVPKKYYELYNGENFNLPPSSSLPASLPSVASTIANSGLEWVRRYQDVPRNGIISDEKTLELIRAYAASVSYMDAQVGRVLDQLDANKLTEKTVIVFVGDHGFHLGEHGRWGKNSLFEVSLHSPLIVSVPGQTYRSVETDALTELVDIYPTLCDACQLPIPSQLEGLSLLPVIEEPKRPWKTAAFSQLKSANVIGNSMRTEQYRYTEWGHHGSQGRELYDYYTDPDETVNIADQPENVILVANLSKQLHAGWQAALPDVSKNIPVSTTSPWDINDDHVVDIQDLHLISSNFGLKIRTHPKVDVNRDGNVDLTDLLLVSAHLGVSSGPNAPPADFNIRPEHFDLVEKWLTEARLADDGSDVFRQGITNLEHLINTASPVETMLLPNYPNPFNPETWIPYQLAKASDVQMLIYDTRGTLVRRLELGHQSASYYTSKSRAAYWDGRNSLGERVASGIYFYQLQAGNLVSSRKMLILK